MKKNLMLAVGAAFVCSQMVWAGAVRNFFVLIPPDFTDWMSSVPMISLDGGESGAPMTAVADMCGWYSYEFEDGVASDNVVIYRDDDIDREDMIGINGNWETAASATPIPLNMLFELGGDSLFFVPDEEQKTNEDGFYFSAADVSGIEGVCKYSLAALIYDTDADLHPAFSCYAEGGEGCQMGAQGINPTQALSAIQTCTGVTPGIVESTLGATKKPKLTTAGKNCFITESFFNQLFNHTSGVNEMTCYDMPFARSSDGRWEFDSDYEMNPKTKEQGGFYPVEYTDMTDKQIDAIVLMSDPTQTPVTKARTKRNAEGPITYGSAMTALDPIEGAPLIDVACNGPGWAKGHDCEGLFADVATTRETLQDWYGLGNKDCVFGIDCKSSTSNSWISKAPEAGRNQHFCFESHAKFTYKPGLRFTFRGSDDLWVYVAGKLAVDLGGTHIPAPAYVDLDNFEGINGALVVGDEYDIDIFYCDRRTPSNSLRIKTNAVMMQKTSIDVKASKNSKNPAETVYSICYTKSGDGSCAAALSGNGSNETYCGSEIINAGLNISYTLVMGNKISSPAVPGFEKVTPGVYKCGIDLSNPVAPKINKDNICGSSAGVYTLFVTINGKSKKIANFRMTGEVDVVYANGTIVDPLGAPTGAKINLVKTAMAGQLVPVYISNVAPAENGNDVEIIPEDAVGIEYTLSYDRLMKVYYKQINSATGGEQFVKLTSGEKRTIGVSGIDTVYAMVEMDDMDAAIKTFKIGVAGRENAMAISYYLPQITFIESIPKKGEYAKSVKGQTPNADGSYNVNFVDSTYNLYLAVLKPNDDGSYSMCAEECDGLEVHSSAMSSPKIKIGDAVFENGYATVSVRALAEYKWSSDPEANNPANIVVAYNDYVQAVYSPMYFSKKGTTGIKRTAPSTLPIAMNSAQPIEFSIMDLQGGIVRSGYTTNAESVVKNLTAGTYVVKIGSNMRRVNIR